MKKLIYASAFLASLSLISCGGSESKNGDSAKTESTEKSASPDVNEADWVVKELGEGDSTQSYYMPAFSMKLPKDIKMEKDTVLNTLIVTFKNNYSLRINYFNTMLNPEWKLADQVAEHRKSSDIAIHLDDIEVKVLADSPNGFSWTTHVKGAKSAPVAHFAYYIADSKGGYMTIKDATNIIDSDEQAAVSSEANTKKIWDLIAGSAAFK